MCRRVPLGEPRRLPWGSDRTQTLGRGRASYSQKVRFVAKTLDFLSESDRRAILGDNALRFLGLRGDAEPAAS